MSGFGSTAAVENYLMLWREEHGANIGEGVSRTSDPKAHFYEMVVEFNGMKPMREWIRAMSRDEAAKFAANRYPTATKITIITKDYVKRPSRKRISTDLSSDQGAG
jgi:hypothetical protein